MKHLKFILTIFVLAISQPIFACDCNSKEVFLKVAPTAQLVALVKVTKYLTFNDIYKEKIPMSMKVEIIEIYKGTETRKTITVWGDNGFLCRPYLSKFKIGQHYVVAFDKGLDGANGYVDKNEKTTDYSISICGEYWLNADLKKEIATSSVTGKQTQISLTDLKTKLKIK